MANTYFQFKAFRIEQDRCAMKVCTDACIQGALAARAIQQLQPQTVLDIGTGTGLLSLMLAQNGSFLRQDAIEINPEAAQQAEENCRRADFPQSIRVIQADVRTYVFSCLYDFIICNPPFYENDWKSPSAARNQAMHAADLQYGPLLDVIDRQLAAQGLCCLMVPHDRLPKMLRMAADHRLYPRHIWQLRQSEKHAPFRAVLLFGRQPLALRESTLVIRQADGNYTTACTDLMHPYYLYL